MIHLQTPDPKCSVFSGSSLKRQHARFFLQGASLLLSMAGDDPSAGVLYDRKCSRGRGELFFWDEPKALELSANLHLKNHTLTLERVWCLSLVCALP